MAGGLLSSSRHLCQFTPFRRRRSQRIPIQSRKRELFYIGYLKSRFNGDNHCWREARGLSSRLITPLLFYGIAPVHSLLYSTENEAKVWEIAPYSKVASSIEKLLNSSVSGPAKALESYVGNRSIKVHSWQSRDRFDRNQGMGVSACKASQLRVG